MNKSIQESLLFFVEIRPDKAHANCQKLGAKEEGATFSTLKNDIRLSPVELELVAELKFKGDIDFLDFFLTFSDNFSDVGFRTFKLIFLHKSSINLGSCMSLFSPTFLIFFQPLISEWKYPFGLL